MRVTHSAGPLFGFCFARSPAVGQSGRRTSLTRTWKIFRRYSQPTANRYVDLYLAGHPDSVPEWRPHVERLPDA